MRLNLGCGKDIRLGWINIDKESGPGVDLVLDLDRSLLPFPNDSVDEILASHILEHLIRWEDMLVEIHRVLKPEGKVQIRVPYSLFPYIYHVRFFLPWTIDGFCVNQDTTSLEARPLFKKIHQQVNYRFWFRWHLKHYLGITMEKALWTFPLGERFEIIWVLEKVKT